MGVGQFWATESRAVLKTVLDDILKIQTNVVSNMNFVPLWLSKILIDAKINIKNGFL